MLRYFMHKQEAKNFVIAEMEYDIGVRMLVQGSQGINTL